MTSEQKPTDGSYYIPHLVKEANDRLTQYGTHGKRAAIKIVGRSLALQFNLKGKQYARGCGCPANKQGVSNAERLAMMVTNQLVANQFSWDWFDALLGRSPDERKQTAKEQLEKFKVNWYKDNEDLKFPDASWRLGYQHLEKVLAKVDEQIAVEHIHQIVQNTPPNTES